MKILANTAEPILVTGAPRSGTTILGRMLSLYHRLSYVDEPFNYQMGVVGVRRQFVHLYNTSPEEEYYQRLIRKLLAGRARFKRHALYQRPRGIKNGVERWQIETREAVRYRVTGLGILPWRYLLKDPMACFSAEYLHRQFGMPVVVVVRHPAAVVGSYRRLGWRFGLSDLTGQPRLMERHLRPLLGNIDPDRISGLDEGALLWASIYKTLGDYIDRNPDILVVRHEDLSADPVVMVQTIYRLLGIPFGPWIERRIRDYTDSNNPTDAPDGVAHALRRNSKGIAERWHGGFDKPQLSRIRNLTEDVAARFYDSNSWEVDMGGGRYIS